LFDELCITGVDRNVARNGAVVTNWGDVYGRVIKTKKLEEKQARLQRSVSRKEEALRKAHGIKPGGSLKGIERPNRLREAQAKLRKFSAKLARIRKDVAHCISKALVDRSDIIVFERLETKAMTSCEADIDALPWEKERNKKTRKDILDVGWALIEAFVKYKALKAGKLLVRVNPAYTSQRCCGCGHIGKENSNDKTNTKHFECVQCGHKEDADVNAAKNIRFLGIEELRKQTQKMASGERTDRSRWRLEGSMSLVKSEKSSSWVGPPSDNAGYANCSGNSTFKLKGSLGL
jgi:putative transposase